MEEPKKKLIHKLRDKYRLIILNQTTYHERFSLSLSPLNVIFIVGAVFFVSAAIVISAFFFTPMKEFIPGYPDPQIKKNAQYAAIKVDSLQGVLSQQSIYLTQVKNILKGNMPNDQIDSTSILSNPPKKENLHPPLEDSILRHKIEEKYKYSLNSTSKNSGEADLKSLYFFMPLRGALTNAFNPKEDHHGVDIAAPKNEAIKTVLDGTVILSSWTSDGGNVIQIQHKHNYISVYKHNSVLLKTQGEKVQAGEAIAIIGNSGELTDAPHLHFELWHEGHSVDPSKYINFE